MGERSLEQHQERVLDRGNKVVYHGLGSGKTLVGLTALARAHAEGKKAIFIAPAPLVNNAHKEIAKHKVDIGDGVIVSADKLVRNPDKYDDDYSVVVVDEAHRLRNPGAKTSIIKKIREGAEKALPMTASVMYNDVSDIAPIVNFAAGSKVMPEGKKDFYNHYIAEVKVPRSVLEVIRGKTPDTVYEIKRPKEMARLLKEHVDRHDVPEGPDFPSKTEEVIHVPMGEHQQKAYNYSMSGVPGELRRKINSGAALGRKDVEKLQMFMTGPRLASLSSTYIDKQTDDSGKLDNAASHLIERAGADRFKAVVYSNYISGGIDPYTNRLDEAGLGDKYQVFKGGLSSKERDKIIDAYNSGDKPILLVSSAGSEGLDLKGTRLVQVLEPHFNKEKIRQVIGRSARYKSHTHLPEDERNVHIQHFLSTTRPTFFSKSKPTVDGTLMASANAKDSLINKVRSLMVNDPTD